MSGAPGKERDSETGLDYFGARYFGSSMGRFMTPDWVAGKPSAVPYAEWADPQSLNLYSYARNNPLSRADADGHDPGDKFKTKNAAAVDAVRYMRTQKNGYKWEYGTRVHQDGKSFSYGPVVTQENPKGVDPPAVQKNDVGDVHTHNYGVGEDAHANNVEQPDRLSTIQDKKDVQNMQDSSGTKVDYQSYVGAPNGDVVQFTPNSNAPDDLGDAKVVQHNVAPDPNPPQPPPPSCKQAGNCKD
jgi:RHS repeat-associated protein